MFSIGHNTIIYHALHFLTIYNYTKKYSQIKNCIKKYDAVFQNLLKPNN